MMYNSPSNPIIYKTLRSCLLRDVPIKETIYDYDQCVYFIESEIGNPLIKFAFASKCTKEILENGGRLMLEDIYKEHALPESQGIAEFDLTLGIDNSKLPQIQKIKKTMDEATATKIRSENEAVKA